MKRNHLAVHVEDHPLEYGTFEGNIGHGEYGAGQVTIWDHGTYETEKWTDREVKVVLHGERTEGRFVLFQTGGKNWMIHRMDAPSREDWQPIPDDLRPMLATLGSLPNDDEHWAYEMKWDGVRALVRVEGGRITIKSRNDIDVTVSYPELRALGRSACTLRPRREVALLLARRTGQLVGMGCRPRERRRPRRRVLQRLLQDDGAVARVDFRIGDERQRTCEQRRVGKRAERREHVVAFVLVVAALRDRHQRVEQARRILARSPRGRYENDAAGVRRNGLAVGAPALREPLRRARQRGVVAAFGDHGQRHFAQP